MKRTLLAGLLLTAISVASAGDIKRHAYESPSIPIARAVELPVGYVTLYHSGLGPQPANPEAAKSSREYWGDTQTQATSVFEQMHESLRSLSWDLQDVVKMTVFLVGDPASGGRMDFAGFMQAYRKYFGTASQPNLPARSTVQVAALAVPGMMVEIEVVLSKAPPARSPERQSAPNASTLRIEKQGSFFVGGSIRQSNALGRDGLGKDRATGEGPITTGQMYVQYQIPTESRHLPVVMIHGCCLSGQSYETTPDGRMGWNEYFLRKGRSVYLVDQVGRGRSGFDATDLNAARLGMHSAAHQPPVMMFDHEAAWVAMRIGPKVGIPYTDTQFPVNAVDEYYKMWIPDFVELALSPTNPTYSNLATLAQKLGGAILMGHSESFLFPAHAALINPSAVKGIISLESGSRCSPPLPFNRRDRVILARIPTLIVFADHLTQGRWAEALKECRAFADSIREEGGDVTVLHLPEVGIRGNTHMFMLDRNNLQIADLLMNWIDVHVERKPKSSLE